MNEVFTILGAVITGIGGSSVMILGLSSWLGKVWANRIFEKEKVKYEKELQDYKSIIDKEMLRLNTMNEKALHITKVQYDKEFEIYQNIWKALMDCIRATKQLYPKIGEAPIKEEELEEFNKEKYSIYSKAYNNFLDITTSNAPFYQEEFYNDLVELRNRCSQIGEIFKLYNWDVKYSATFAMARDTKMDAEDRKEVYQTLPKEIDEYKEKLLKGIRTYLKELRVN